MVLDVFAAAAVVAFGLLAAYFSLNKSESDRNLAFVILASVIMIVGGSWYLVSRLTLVVILTKLAAFILAAIGLFLVIGFPDVHGEYQPEGFSKAGVFIGLVLLIAGVYALVFV